MVGSISRDIDLNTRRLKLLFQCQKKTGVQTVYILHLVLWKILFCEILFKKKSSIPTSNHVNIWKYFTCVKTLQRCQFRKFTFKGIFLWYNELPFKLELTVTLCCIIMKLSMVRPQEIKVKVWASDWVLTFF